MKEKEDIKVENIKIEQVDLDCSVISNEENENLHATNLWFQNGTIVVRWVDENGADYTSNLLEENVEIMWEIIKSIKK